MNVPLIWAAAGDEEEVPVLERLVEVADDIPGPLDFHGGNINAGEAAQTGWACLRDVLRSWGAFAREDLTGLLHNHRFAGTLPDNHIQARAQQHILGLACAADGRVALLEAVFVSVTIHLGRQLGVVGVAHDPPPQK